MRSDREETLEAEIARLDGLGLQELRQVWRQRLGPPPQHISTELTRRRLAYELAGQGLRWPQTGNPASPEAVLQGLQGRSSPYAIVQPRSQAGPVLTREWNGTEHRVTVQEKGFEYRDEQYGSLSQVARPNYRQPLVGAGVLWPQAPKGDEAMTAPIRRCAVYTRKSSEEGLEQSFNSLHAQREACEAYIRSQAHEGWKLVKTAYDDGGFSGGTMERPGLAAADGGPDRGP